MRTKGIRNLAIATLATTALAGVAVAPTVSTAAQNPDKVIATTKAVTDNPNLQLSEDGFRALRNIRAARISIFDGNTEAATNYVNKAGTDLGKAKADEKLIVSKEGAKAENNYIPIDGQIAIAQSFITTPEKAKHIAAGNTKLKEGKTKEAIDELKLADVDVGFSRVLMPIASTETNVEHAADLLKTGKYYEANMALKTAEDGLIVDTVMLVEAPKAAQSKSKQSETDQSSHKTSAK